MKRVLVVMGGALLASLLATGGCVPKSELDKALALNKAAQTELEKTQAALRELRAQNQTLLDQVAAYQQQLAAKDQQLANLEAAYAALKKSFDELAAKSKAPPQIIEVPGVALPAELDELLQQLARDNPNLLEYDRRLGMVKFKSDLTFAPGSDNVTGPAQGALEKFAQIMNSPAATKFNVYVAGHTDDIPIGKPETRMRHPNNWYLSVHRAVAVLKVLKQAGVSDPRMAAMGFGEWHPIAPNAPGNKGNALNRRVEIWVVPPDRFLTPAVSSVVPEAEVAPAPPAAPAMPDVPAAPAAPVAPAPVVPTPPPPPAP
ncbi:MAG: Motility protein B [Planctomycetes bacterium ADurb.Bin126]|nr:MAG: Motility protein B [Planctomycetes bacterium ADurb.Bin126]HQL73524.1 OmpA family protein [Phycisphaerae bacterium]